MTEIIMMVLVALVISMMHFEFCPTRSRLLKGVTVVTYMIILVGYTAKYGLDNTLQGEIIGGLKIILLLFIADICILLVSRRFTRH